MRKLIPLLMVVASAAACTGKSSGPVQSRAEKDPRIIALEQSASKMTAEQKDIIEKAKAMKPEVNSQPAGKTLGEIADEYTNNKGSYNIIPIAWDASQKKNGRWKLLFHYQDYQKQITSAEWEYDIQQKKVYPFETKNAPGFWVADQTAATKTGKPAR